MIGSALHFCHLHYLLPGYSDRVFKLVSVPALKQRGENSDVKTCQPVILRNYCKKIV